MLLRENVVPRRGTCVPGRGTSVPGRGICVPRPGTRKCIRDKKKLDEACKQKLHSDRNNKKREISYKMLTTTQILLIRFKIFGGYYKM